MTLDAIAIVFGLFLVVFGAGLWAGSAYTRAQVARADRAAMAAPEPELPMMASRVTVTDQEGRPWLDARHLVSLADGRVQFLEPFAYFTPDGRHELAVVVDYWPAVTAADLDETEGPSGED